jgi:hypothetical protein
VHKDCKVGFVALGREDIHGSGFSFHSRRLLQCRDEEWGQRNCFPSGLVNQTQGSTKQKLPCWVACDWLLLYPRLGEMYDFGDSPGSVQPSGMEGC